MLPIVGIGAGLVSALLFAVVITGSPLAALLYSASPLPIFIAALGWNHRAGLYATVAGALTIAVALSPTAGIAFAIIIALPAWWIAYLALLARQEPSGTEWYPLGHLLLWIAGTAALITVGSALVMTTDYEAYRSVIARIIENLLTEMVRARLLTLPADVRVTELAQSLAPAVPVGIGASFVTTIAPISGSPPRRFRFRDGCRDPGPSFPATTLPRQALTLLVLSLRSPLPAASSASPARP
jgi:hypothetical protein